MQMIRMILLAILFLARAVPAQDRIATVNQHAWYNYFGDHPLSKNWGIHLEGQWRRHDLGLKWQQLLLRPGVNYELNANVTLTAGYAFVDTFRYGDYPAPFRFPEHRLFEQVLLKQNIGRVNFQHRYRLEQRYLGQKDQAGSRIESWRYENRFRYLVKASIPFTQKGKTYLALYDEIFVNFGRNVAANVFDQNRAYVAVGFPIAKETKLEAGYMMQTVQQRNGRVFEWNNTLQVGVFSTLPFGKGD